MLNLPNVELLSTPSIKNLHGASSLGVDNMTSEEQKAWMEKEKDRLIGNSEAICGTVRAQRGCHWNNETRNMPTPKPVYGSYWTEGEIACLFADSNAGKSILAVQIANEIALRGDDVVYFDFEMSQIQFYQRYTSPVTGLQYEWPYEFIRAQNEPWRHEARVNEYDKIINYIAQTCFAYNAKYLIIDNINTLTTKGQDGEAALMLMEQLRTLKMEHDLTVLVIAHTPKRDQGEPITDNDLAGSKNLFNVFDSVFALGKTTVNSDWRYLKQLKVRSAAKEHDADNVEVLSIVMPEDGFLHFKSVKCCHEREMLRKEKNFDLREQAMEMLADGMEVEQVAKSLKVHRATIYRWQAKANATKCDTMQPNATDMRQLPF